MGRQKIIISKNKLINLYLKKNLSPYKIGALLGCSFSTITNRLIEHRIPLKTQAAARMKYPKINYANDLLDKAYMIGFRIGDLNVYRPSRHSETIVVRCHTTQQEQVDVMRSLFAKFGKFSAIPKNGHFYVNCFLNNSFEFLIPKSKGAWEWIKEDQKTALAFIAGYNDAEGNFIINQGRGRFKIDTYDVEVLEWMASRLVEFGIHATYRRIYKMGDIWNGRYPLNKNLWRININRASDLERFIIMQLPYLRHRTRIRDAKVCLRNILQRRINGSIK